MSAINMSNMSALESANDIAYWTTISSTNQLPYPTTQQLPIIIPKYATIKSAFYSSILQSYNATLNAASINSYKTANFIA
jgi:hypothetical protein